MIITCIPYRIRFGVMRIIAGGVDTPMCFMSVKASAFGFMFTKRMRGGAASARNVNFGFIGCGGIMYSIVQVPDHWSQADEKDIERELVGMLIERKHLNYDLRPDRDYELIWAFDNPDQFCTYFSVYIYSEWRSSVSEPTLLIKIQTAISILVDQNPEAVFKALIDKYKPTSAIAKAIWKRSWNIAQSKEQLKLFIFDLADRKSTRLNSSHRSLSRMPSSA